MNLYVHAFKISWVVDLGYKNKVWSFCLNYFCSISWLSASTSTKAYLQVVSAAHAPVYSRLPSPPPQIVIKVKLCRLFWIKSWSQGLSEWSPFGGECRLFFFGAHGSTFLPNMSQDLAAQTKRFPEQLDPLNLYTSLFHHISFELTDAALQHRRAALYCPLAAHPGTPRLFHKQFYSYFYKSVNFCLFSTKKINTGNWLQSVIFVSG